MMQNNCRSFLFLVVFLSSVTAIAQPKDNSPFSRFGIGDILTPNHVALQSFGGINGAYADPYHVNLVNPASVAYLKSTAFEGAVFIKNSTFDDGQNQANILSGNLSYISLGFPLRNPITDVIEKRNSKTHFGMNLSLAPYSQVAYNILSEDIDPDIGTIERTYTGNGGSYKFLWTNAVRYDDLSFGVNVGYVFGNMQYSRRIEPIDLFNPFLDEFSDDINISGFVYDFGVQYGITLNKKEKAENNLIPTKKIFFGLHYNGRNAFTTNTKREQYRVNEIEGNVAIRDTILFDENNEGTGYLPSELGFGVYYRSGNKWNAGFSYERARWSEYENSVKTEALTDSWRFAAGASYMPDINAFNKYYKRMYYRFGFFTGRDPILASIQEEGISTYGISLGVGMPLVLGRNISNVDLGLELGRKLTDNSLKETYFRFTAGFSINDNLWFYKRKYD